MIEIIPSILSETYEDAQRKLDLCEDYVSKVHLDICDGSFVKTKTFSMNHLEQLHTSCEIRAHLMVANPLAYARILKGKVSTLFVHYEAVEDIQAIVDILHRHFHVGIALNMNTPPRRLFSLLDKIDEVLLMTVTTGYGGGEFHEEPIKKALQLKCLKPDLRIGVDGGVHCDTAKIIGKYPIDFVTPGSELFGKGVNFHDALLNLKKSFYSR